MKKINKISIVTVLVFMFGFIGSNVALAAVAPTLGSLSTYSVVSSTFTNSNTSPQTKIYGDVCATTQPTTVPLLITGTTTTPCASARNTEQIDVLTNATYGLKIQSCISLPTGAIALDSYDVNAATGHDAGTFAAGTYPAGCYEIDGVMNITTGQTVTLDGENDPDAVFIFRSKTTSQALNSAANSSIALKNSASSANVFWAPTGLATIGANASLSITPTFIGTIVDAAGITFGKFANLEGRAIAFGGTVTTDANTITTVTPLTLNIIKHVVNDNGGTAIASDFNVHVKRGGVEISGSPQDGSEAPGTSYSVSAGDFVISEDANSEYTQSFAGTCSGGNITVSTDDQVCIITNDDINPTLTLKKVVVGGDNATDWTLTATGPTGFEGAGPTVNNGASFDIGTYNLSETGPSGYTASDWVCVGGTQVDGDTVTLALDGDATCTITNTYIDPVSSSGGTTYGCKDPTATNYNAFSSSRPELCLYEPTITILSTPVVIVPKLPKAGFPPQTWYGSLLNSFLNLFR